MQTTDKMGSWLRRVVVALALVPGLIAFPLGDSYTSMAINGLFARQSNDDFDPEDLSFITKMAAVGDSYSAGIGAGERLGDIRQAFIEGSDYSCSRYEHSYPQLIHTDGRLGNPSTRSFQFKSCSGAVVKDVVEKQIPSLDSLQQVILLSAGGNDAELTQILNHCVFQWASFTSAGAEFAKAAAETLQAPWLEKLYHWFDNAVTCEEQLDRSEAIINSDNFRASLDTVAQGLKTKLAPGGMVYWTGYAKFWGEALTSECDSVSWMAWAFHSLIISQPKAYLTSDRRRRMNVLVELMNSKLAAAVERAGSSFEFVDYDRYPGLVKGRFCEPGVNEASGSGINEERFGLMFYEMNSLDPLGNSPWKRSLDPLSEGTTESIMNALAELYSLTDDEAVLAGEQQMRLASAEETKINALADGLAIPKPLPDGYGRVFHPTMLLHQVIANLVIFHMSNWNSRNHNIEGLPEIVDVDMGTCPLETNRGVMRYRGTAPGKEVKPGTELRILCAGDSITVGFLSDQNGGDGNGYRLKLKQDLSRDEVVYAGTVSGGSMRDGYYAAWSGKTIQYIADHIGPSLEQRPNIILLHAGTNDMNPNSGISTEGNDPAGAADRLGKLIDQMFKACPDAVVIVAMIVNTCDENQSPRTKSYQSLIPGVVSLRRNAGKHVLAADFTSYPLSSLQDCIHPTNDGYHLFGDYWYDFITQIPKDWINDPVEPLTRGRNGGIDTNIPPPDWGVSPVKPGRSNDVRVAYEFASYADRSSCKITPRWYWTGGSIALGGVGHNGDWHYNKGWVEAGQVASGLKRDPKYVRLHDMNGDGKADYVWLEPDTGEITCWINNLPEPWAPAGNNGGVIGSGGVGPADSIYLADMNGDGLDDYLVVNPDNGAVRIWWNYGPDSNWVNGWKFVEGGEIATGVPHANWDTLRFPDINGDGRADYVYIGEHGALKHHMNTGTAGGQDPLFIAMGGIATGASEDISAIVFADMDGDGRDDYLIWDDDGGLTGYLNQQTNREGVPLYIAQGPPKTIADGIGQRPSSIRLSDLDGDGKDDYAYVDQDGAIWLWWNRGTADTSMTIDGLRFADIDGDGVDDYVWLDPVSGAPTVFINKGFNALDPLAWLWQPLNGGSPIASGAAPAAHVKFGDIDGDGKDDYVVLDSQTGALDLYLNKGEDRDFVNGWRWEPFGQIASGLGPGANVRIADIDGDGKDDYIFLHPNGGRTTIYRNVFDAKQPGAAHWRALPEADASGIGQRPKEIELVDVNGDGKADYVWTSALDGRVKVWFNDYPNQPTWLAQGEIAGGVGTSGANVRWADLQGTGRASYIAVDPNTGGLAAWLNGCDDMGPKRSRPTPGKSKPAPPKDSPCFSDETCQSYGCPGGGDARCTASG
ncbi:uncharacterized protein PgNI_09260 [Pyricularia grisea]|uniref:SGNH hydrolase-type esterase domain-containing protein n=1 Tax=Pyricularia grisea TaxID=148305 RepID=A0A6P8ASA8_PYRGI|nr:uncharacterized protein PgNI_09260 [Pyricularia grisea]TLD05009.1 hypothetical protein PgNI_09260 [Pyricularia grisea]